MGGKSWFVDFEGNYTNERPPHVELVSQKVIGEGVKGSIYYTMISGTRFN